MYANLAFKKITALGLPPGPFDDALPYWVVGEGSGKYHSSRNCRRITRHAKQRLKQRGLHALEVTPARTCSGCNSAVPGPASDHYQWCLSVETGLNALAKAGHRSPYSRHFDAVAQDGGYTMRAATSLYHALVMMNPALSIREAPIPELAAVLEDVTNRLERTLAEAKEALPVEEWERAEDGKVIVALTNYTPQHSSYTERDELYVRSDVVAALPDRWAYALTNPGVAARLPDAHVIGPVEAGDDRTLLVTAMRLLAERLGPSGRHIAGDTPDERIAQLRQRMTESLYAARAVSAAPAA